MIADTKAEAFPQKGEVSLRRENCVPGGTHCVLKLCAELGSVPVDAFRERHGGNAKAMFVKLSPKNWLTQRVEELSQDKMVRINTRYV